MSNQSKIIQHCIEHLQTAYRFSYPESPKIYSDFLGEIVSEVLGIIARSDASYHDLEHTLQVVLVGQEMLQGRQQAEGDVSPETWLNVLVALVCHDVGYCRGACQDDQRDERRYATGTHNSHFTILPPTATDASLGALHVDRSKLFVAERFAQHPALNVDQLQSYIERTRFPVMKVESRAEAADFGSLARAADLIGQLGDPKYLFKMGNLFEEFAETGSHHAMGYNSVADLRASYPSFFWNRVFPYVQAGVRYLELTASGQSILSNLYSNVRIVEAELTQQQPPDKGDQPFNTWVTGLRRWLNQASKRDRASNNFPITSG